LTRQPGFLGGRCPTVWLGVTVSDYSIFKDSPKGIIRDKSIYC
jgi:hypothetical protein